ncbi:hypothetical protein ACFFMN_14345 [Planobispora siamensis]|uniref:Transmembrane protein n=1 Tax=Planobispora siamensis TaxID=936338 RepID=A0A8J3SCS6_9ACTN|nr:hypothetical protein [Planobispora siamensis]GIH89454.1 hypothetical protein Psi01_00840 [Planobispora siamensis]
MTNAVHRGNAAPVRTGLLVAAAGALAMGIGLTVVSGAAWILGMGVAALVAGSVQAAMASRRRTGRRPGVSPAYIGGSAVAFGAVMIGAVRVAAAGHWWIWSVVGALAAAVLVVLALRQGRV